MNKNLILKNRTKTKLKEVTQLVGFCFVILLTIIPILRIVYFLATTGVNNPSNDDVWYISIIDKVLLGKYHWGNYFHDTFSRDVAYAKGHSDFFPILLQISLAYFGSSNIYYISLFFGIGLVTLKLLFLYDAFTCLIKDPLRWVLLPILAALLFASSQISVFEYGLASLEQGFYQLGASIGIWALVKYKDRGVGILWTALGGLVASWSWGGGPLIWPVFFIGAILLRLRRWVLYLVWLVTGLISSLPYLIFLIFRNNSTSTETLLGGWFNFSLLLKSIGWPFSQSFSMSMAETRGLIGLLLGILAVIIVSLRRDRTLITQSVPGIMLISLSVLNMWQISIFRGQLVAWYASPYMLFWVGLVDLGYVIWANGNKGFFGRRFLEKVTHSFSIIYFVTLLGVIFYFYSTSNLTIEDKTEFLKSRSDVAAACLRHYKNAPTYCQTQLFPWEQGQFGLMSQLAIPLDRHQLSVFAPHQRWTLQGEFILDNVKSDYHPFVPKNFWSADLTNHATSFMKYKRLNLFLHSPNSLEWTITLPPNLKRADFYSAIAISKSAPYDQTADGVIFEVWVKTSDKSNYRYFSQLVAPDQRDWEEFSIPLEKFTGQTITITLTSNPRWGNVHDWAMFRYPYIDLILNKTKQDTEEKHLSISPSNTDLSPLLAKPTLDDLALDVTNRSLWLINGMMAATNSIDTWKVGEDPNMEFKQPLNICLSDYTHFYIKMAASPEITQRMAQIYFKLGEQTVFDEPHSVKIPLLGDGKIHEYTYDLKLLEHDPQAKITGIRMDPVVNGGAEDKGLLKISDFRLLRGNRPSACQ